VIIDFHTHIYPDHLAFDTLNAICERSRIRSYSDGTLKGLLHSMDRAGIDLSVVLSVATKPEQVDPIIQWHNQIRQPGIFPLAPMHPDLGADTDLIHSLKAQGFKGIKMHPDYQNFYVDEKRMSPLYEAIQTEGLFILFHAGVDRGLPSPVHGTPERFARLHKAFPHLRIIAAHMGGEYMFEEAEEYLIGTDIYLDTSFVLQEMPASLIQRFFDRHSIERFLFATDSPWKDQKKELDFFLSLPFLTQDAKEKITCANAAGLLKL